MVKNRPSTIDDIGKVLLEQLSDAGWKVEIEDDSQKFKHFCAFNKNAPLGAFTRLDILLFILNNDPTNMEIRFLFLADPQIVGPNKRPFGKKVRESNFKVLRDVCVVLMKGGIEAREEETEIRTKSLYNYRDNFGKDEFINPAYEVEMVYWKQPLH